MSRRKRIVLYVIIVLVTTIAFNLYILFMGFDEQYDYIAGIIGILFAGAICCVKCSAKSKSIEWKGNQIDDDQDRTE